MRFSWLLVSALLLTSCLDVNVEIVDNTPPELPPIDPIVLGQPDFSTNTAYASASATTFSNSEYKIHSDGTRLLISDYMNSRVLIWNSIPTSTQQPADLVLGQPDMNSNTCNNGGLSAASLCRPGGVYTNGTKVFVVDYSNHRILIWNTFPTTNKAPADVVLGQPNMTSNTSNQGGISARSLYAPWHIYLAGSKLLVSDYGNNRVLIWNTIPTSNHALSDVVVGQQNMTSNADGSSAPTAENLAWPYEITSDGTRLFVADTGSNRILIWNSIPTSNGASANVVLGQTNMISNVTGVTNASTVSPLSIFIYNGKIFSLDSNGKRLLVWNTIPSVNNTPADVVFGQPDFTTSTANTGGVSQSSIGNYPEGIFVNDRRVFLGDPGNSRVLVLPNDF